MILYHGSNISIETIDLNRSKPYKDFGRAFYLSDEETQAQEMAQAKCIQFGGTPNVTAFEVDEAQMNLSCISASKSTIENGHNLYTTIGT